MEIFLSNFVLVCQKIVQQRYGIPNSMPLTNRSLTPQTMSNVTIHPANPLSPVSNQVRLVSNSHHLPTSYIAGNTNLSQTSSPSYHYQQEQHPMLVLPTQNFPIAQLAQCFNNQSPNGILKDRNNQQQIPIDKRSRSFKEPVGNSLSTLKEAQSLPAHEGHVRIEKG